MYFNIKNLILLILYIYNNLVVNILVVLIEKIIMMEKIMWIIGLGMLNWNFYFFMFFEVLKVLNELIYLVN